MVYSKGIPTVPNPSIFGDGPALVPLWAGGGSPRFDLVKRKLEQQKQNNGGQPVNRMFTSKKFTI